MSGVAPKCRAQYEMEITFNAACMASMTFMRIKCKEVDKEVTIIAKDDSEFLSFEYWMDEYCADEQYS